MPLIDVQHLTFAYRDQDVLSDVCLTLQAGEHLAILGGNSCGKTTLGHWLAGRLTRALNTSSSGTLYFDGRPWDQYSSIERAQAVQFVGQLPEQQITGLAYSVEEEIAFGVRNLGLPEPQVRQRVDHVLQACGLQDLAQVNPFNLSGGELQRLSIAAAMAMQPRLLILDEPGSNLDPASRRRLVDSLQQLQADTTLILLDVSVELAVHLARRLTVLEQGQLYHYQDVDALLKSAQSRRSLIANPAADVSLLLRDAEIVADDSRLPLTADALVQELKEASHA